MAANVMTVQLHGSCIHKPQLRRVPVTAARVHKMLPMSCKFSLATHHRSRFCGTLLRAQEDSSSSIEQDASSSEEICSEAPALDVPTQLQQAKEQVETGNVDLTFMGSFLTGVETELSTLKENATAAEAKAAQLEPQVAKANDQLLRLTADFENYRKRTASEKESTVASTKADFITQLLPVIDNFELARSQLKCETEGEQKIESSYQNLYRQLVDVFRGAGLEAVSGEGHPFDPEVHEAIMREPSSEVPDGTILQEFRKGFKLKDRLLRPAMVKVSFDDGSNGSASSAEEPAAPTEEKAAAEA